MDKTNHIMGMTVTRDYGKRTLAVTVVDPILCRVVSLEKKRHKIELA